MLGKWLSRPVCWLSGHSRARGRVRLAGSVHVSDCRRCGTAMRRIPGRIWVADGLARKLCRVAEPIPTLQPADLEERKPVQEVGPGMLTGA